MNSVSQALDAATRVDSNDTSALVAISTRRSPIQANATTGAYKTTPVPLYVSPTFATFREIYVMTAGLGEGVVANVSEDYWFEETSSLLTWKDHLVEQHHAAMSTPTFQFKRHLGLLFLKAACCHWWALVRGK